jgi:hypothetical protein
MSMDERKLGSARSDSEGVETSGSVSAGVETSGSASAGVGCSEGIDEVVRRSDRED